jgi:hypothetical protein
VSELTPEQKLHRKLFAARKATKAVEKHGNGEGFKFARFTDVHAEASEQLEKQKILILPEVTEEKLRLSSNGFGIATVVMEFEVIDTTSGGSLKRRFSGTGHDSPGDKALFKAITGCEKYFLAKLLDIPFGTDPEAEEHPPAQEPQNAEAERIREQQDEDAEQPDAPPKLRPLPESDLPEADWEGLNRGGDVDAA